MPAPRSSRFTLAVAVTCAAALGIALAGTAHLAAQQGSDRKIWDGVYSAEQAARGKPAYETSCGRCHNNALLGSDRAPALKGEGFLLHWENDSLERLFTKIRDTMPAGGIESVTDAGKLDILAYMLSVNGAAPGRAELPLDTAALDAIAIVRQGGATGGVSNFNLVQLVGCLTPGVKNSWRLTRASEPVATKDETPTAALLAAAAGRPLGTLDFGLLSVVGAYRAESQTGYKVEARGLLFRSSSDNLLNLTSLQSLDERCS